MESKRLATNEEVEEALALHRIRFPDDDVTARYNQSISEGYKDEVCGKCAVVFLAFHHLTRCREEGCPMSTGKSLLDYMKESVDNEVG